MLAVVPVNGAELKQVFPADVQTFISDREGCDHFRGEPRDFDESYIRKYGEEALNEQADRAQFLDQKTEELCYQMDKRLTLLKRKYLADAAIVQQLSQYDYLEIDHSLHINISQYFPNRELVQQKLRAAGFTRKVAVFDNGPLPSKLTVQINRKVDVNSALLVIETLRRYGAWDIGVVVLPQGNVPAYDVYLSYVIVGDNPVGNNQVYTGGEIDDLLSAELTQEEFEKLAKPRMPETVSADCSRKMNNCMGLSWGCVFLTVPRDASCDKDCQAQVLDKLYASNIPTYAGIGKKTIYTPPSSPRGCVGYTKNLVVGAAFGGTESGARCIAKLLGYQYLDAGCNESGGAFTVKVH